MEHEDQLESKKQFQTGLFIITTNRDGIGEKALNECKITILDDEELFENIAKTLNRWFMVMNYALKWKNMEQIRKRSSTKLDISLDSKKNG